MAEKLSITIALEGGKQIEQQLASIGEEGQKAFQKIRQEAEKVGGFKNLKPEEVTQKLKDMGVTGKDALDKITGAVAQARRMESIVGVVQRVETGFAGMSTAAVGFARALGPIGAAVGVVGGAMVKMAADASDAIIKIDRAAIKAGMSIEKFDTLRQGFEKMGMSDKGVTSAMGGIAEAAAKGKLAQVAKDLEEAKKGFSGQKLVSMPGFGMVTESMQRLIETARGVGPAVEPAKKALEELGIKLAPNVTKSLSEMIQMWGSASEGTAAFVEQLRTMPDSSKRSELAIDGFKDAGTELVQALRSGAITDDQFKERLGTISTSAADASNKFEQSTNRMKAAWDRFKTTGDTSQLGAMWTELSTQAGLARDAINSATDSMKAKIGEFVSSIGGDIWSAFSSAGTAAISTISGAIDALISKVNELIRKMAEVGNVTPGGGGGPGEAIPGNAAGGLIGGRGTGTSDSNLAWVSRGEYITPARAVRQPGVLALLEALRRTGGNMRGVMNGMGRFAMGGLIPGFAAGGLVGGMGHLGTVDLRTDHGVVRLMAGASAIEQLSRLATTKRMTSTGKKPGFYGG